jgi:flagellar biosynthetic protein FlhB
VSAGSTAFFTPRNAPLASRNGSLALRGAPFARRGSLFIDLQWFAKPEDEGRTEQPSEQKLRRARVEEGRVPKSQELTGALGLLFPALSLILLAPYMLRTCVEMVRFFFTRALQWDAAQDRAVAAVFAQYFLRLAMPVLVVAVVAGVFGHLVQSGFIFTTKPLKPDFSKIVPHFGQYFSRTIFSLNGLYNLAKSFFKMGVIGAAAYVIIAGDITKIMNLQRASLWTGVSLIAALTAKLLITTGVLLLVLSVPDYLFQRYQFMQQMKMSRLEVQEERKMDEGDPLVKSRIRARMRQIMAQNLRQAVPKADVIITNPTHFACAVVYEQGKMEGPVLLAKGEDEMAFQIRRLAEEAGVPIVENKPLARAIYAQVEIGDVIPVLYWEAIAAILAKVMAINDARRRVRAEV